ncbi:MAG: hypothetical protein IAF08_14825 [Rhizobacter sp.]|nr:hypothetical protein [Chlorobiales bacterium]
MMHLKRAILLLFVLFVFASPVLAGNPSPFGKDLIPRGQFGLGAHPTLLFGSGTSTFVFFGHFGYGITSGIAINGHVGFGANNYQTYIGGDLRFDLLQSRGIGLNLLVGGHTGGQGAGFDAAFVFSADIRNTVGIMLALDADFIVQNGGTTPPVHLDAGVQFPLSRQIDLILTGEIGITQTAVSGISGGLQFYF